jgi:hypothetical protein
VAIKKIETVFTKVIHLQVELQTPRPVLHGAKDGLALTTHTHHPPGDKVGVLFSLHDEALQRVLVLGKPGLARLLRRQRGLKVIGVRFEAGSTHLPHLSEALSSQGLFHGVLVKVGGCY